MAGTPSAGPDTLQGTSGDDIINGLAGDDSINGHAGADRLNGGADNDTLVSGHLEGPDTLIGGTGTDHADIFRSTLTDNLTLDLRAGGLSLSDGTSASGIETFRFYAGSGHDQIWASDYAGSTNLDNVVDGGPGDDLLFAGVHGAELIGGGGLDTLLGGRGDDRLWGGQDRDVIKAGGGDDWAVGDTSGDFKDKIVGGRGDDTLWGSGGSDRLDGGDGDDHLHGEYGNNALTGGAGADTFYFGSSWDRETIVDYIDGDVIDFGNSALGAPATFDTLGEFRDAVEDAGYHGHVKGDDVVIRFDSFGVLALLDAGDDWNAP